MKLYEPFDFLTSEECQEIIYYGRSRQNEKAKVHDYNTRIDGEIDEKSRQSNICWYHNPKYKSKILEAFQIFDKDVFVRDLLQITFYKPNGFFDWHTDQLIPKRSISDQSKWFQRTLSMTVELQSSPQSGLFLDSNVHPNIPRNEDLSIKIKPGQAFVFPSTDYHMAKNVGNGQRISLVAWAVKLMR